MVIIAVKDGIPPIISDIPIAIGAVTFLGNKLNMSSSCILNCNDKIYVIKMAKTEPIMSDIRIALLFKMIKCHFL